MSQALKHAGLPEDSDISKASAYRPANGSEGDMFVAQWCAVCRKDTMLRGGDTGCPILADSMVGQPNQWRSLHGTPLCTAFVDHKTPRSTSSSKAKRLDDEGQMSLFSLSEEDITPLEEPPQQSPSPSPLTPSLMSWLRTVSDYNLKMMTRLMGKPQYKSLITQLQQQRMDIQARLEGNT